MKRFFKTAFSSVKFLFLILLPQSGIMEKENTAEQGIQQRRLDSYYVTFSTNEIASLYHCFCEDF